MNESSSIVRAEASDFLSMNSLMLSYDIYPLYIIIIFLLYGEGRYCHLPVHINEFININPEA